MEVNPEQVLAASDDDAPLTTLFTRPELPAGSSGEMPLSSGTPGSGGTAGAPPSALARGPPDAGGTAAAPQPAYDGAAEAAPPEPSVTDIETIGSGQVRDSPLTLMEVIDSGELDAPDICS